MIEIKYKGNYELSDTEGETIAEARGRFKDGFKIAEKAAAFFNGKKISRADEANIVLKDKDSLTFKNTGVNKLAVMAGALILALAVTGGVFAYGFTNASATISAVTMDYNFASVSANASSLPAWTMHGMQKGETGTGTLFDIDTATSTYPGDFTVTITVANADELVSVYRSLMLSLEVRDSANNLVDINGDGMADSADFTVLSLQNGTVTFNIRQVASDVYTVLLRNGSFICNLGSPAWSSSSGAPQLYCELAQM